ncbi:winged helix-turn-helix domain-containing protein [Kitasatospora cathayae]|uniref:Winged helix-turn-helix domain-containing protein n=1 Tax=Kitasatospora cathayae TaxID=3004092 RepID=A0ABY7QF31_9ACTN|nr:winged helix-turn-helix domain-containing protein [Kitasatospora sp. HUAS 3-15]WBP91368.1 winged helix-turn-helix domain-containing protein [Kitasatospora sp. HUAS 3-15]
MVYRIHFTVQDLARTRVAELPPPLWELSTAIRVLQDRNHPVRFDAWRRNAFAGLGPQARMVLDLTPPRGWAPGFLATSGAGSPQELLEQVRSTPESRIRQSLAFLAERQPLPPWAHRLPGDRDLLLQLFDSLEHVCTRLLTPLWPQIGSLTAADRGARMRQVFTGGTESLLTSLNPRRIRWNPPVLEVAMASGLDGHLHLGGRGLLLVPSVFGIEAPVIAPDAEPQPLLTYPAGLDQHVRALPLPLPASPAGPTAPGAPSSLASLLGLTRASVLNAIAEHPGCSTKELAALVGIAPASASEHATTLREAGLISTARHRNTALHSPTGLGISLLNAGHGTPRPGEGL